MDEITQSRSNFSMITLLNLLKLYDGIVCWIKLIIFEYDMKNGSIFDWIAWAKSTTVPVASLGGGRSAPGLTSLGWYHLG